MGPQELAFALRRKSRRWWPEVGLAVSACVIFLSVLDSVELWGKREQRASAEALDTVENQHWLVAEIQGRPRLEKPPLPRWTIAALLTLTGRRTAWVVRLPSALAALATVALIYSLGTRIGGRRLGLISSMILCTTGLFITELRQAGNDGPLALFTTLALFAVWNRLHGGLRKKESLPTSGEINATGSRIWNLVFQGALGLGFLCKGPIIVLLVGVTVVPYLATIRRIGSGTKSLVDLPGLGLFLMLALCWPVPVLIKDPNALGVWFTEMGQKTGILPIVHRERSIFGLEFPLLVLPWSVVAMMGGILPLVRRRYLSQRWNESHVWFPWWWTIGNLAVFSCWAVAKPNYYVPCVPGLALLVGMAWIRLSRVAHLPTQSTTTVLAKLLLQSQWLVLLLTSSLMPLVSRRYLPDASSTWLIIVGVAVSSGITLGWLLWWRGKELLALLPVTACCALGVVIGYGQIAPTGNAARGHRRLALELERLVPTNIPTIRFLHEIDEGLWFYLRGHRLLPLPGSQPRYSNSYDKLGDLIKTESAADPPPDAAVCPQNRVRQLLLGWLEHQDRLGPYVLIRDALYDLVASDLRDRVTPVYLEKGLKRTNLILLRARSREALTSGFAMSGGPAH
jgi:4-amino-4-deoxy-L-arabinose transferase-like glycosyltransferase